MPFNEEPTHTYLDITLCNNKIDINDTTPVPIVFNTKRDADYLQNPNDYFVSVIRWSLDARLPIIVPQLQVGSSILTDAKGQYWNSVYNITLQYNKIESGVLKTREVSTFVKFRPQRAIKPPFTTITNVSKTFDEPYFYIDSIQYFMSLVNDTLQETFIALRTLYGTGVATFQDNTPILQYNYDGNFSLVAPVEFFQGTTTTEGRGDVYFNSSLYTLFNGLNAYEEGLKNEGGLGLKNYKILFADATQETSVAGATMIYTQTEYPVVPFWSPVSSIVFTSQGIPVEPTNTNPTTIVGNSIGAVENNLNLSSVITDFDVNLNIGTESRNIIYYATGGEYRFFDLNSNRPLADINIIAGWKDKLSGAIHSLYLFSGAGATLKLLFRKKNFYSNQGY